MKIFILSCFVVLLTTNVFGQEDELNIESSLNVSYNHVCFDGYPDSELHGVGLDFMKSTPLDNGWRVDAGASVNYYIGKKEYFYSGEKLAKIDLQFCSVKIPVNIGYRFDTGKVFVQPYAGLYLRGNICGTYRINGGDKDAFSNNIDNDLVLRHFQTGYYCQKRKKKGTVC